jgi:EmrB/QacA subfamily drug resistance transporter
MSSNTVSASQHLDPHAGAHAAHPTGPEDPEDSGPRRSWAVLAVALTAQILVVLDISVVNTALPTIGQSLSLSGGQLQWLVTAYLMMSGGGLLLGGRIADLMSRRTVFLTGLTVFTTASLVSGFATGGTELIAARAAQGVAAALLTPSALSLVMTTYTGVQRKKGLALWGAVGSLGVAVGVLLGGFITTAASWEFIFWINGPIGVVALLTGARVVPRNLTSRASMTQFDLPGAVTVIGGLAALIYALGASGTDGWTSPQTLGGLVVSGVLIAAFLTLERRAAAPLFPPHIWTLNSLVSGTTVMLGVTGILVGSVFLTSIFVQTVLGFSALQAGVAFLPFAFAITVGTLVARHLLAHASARVIATAGLMVVASAAAVLSTASGDSGYATGVLPGFVALGVGVGMVFVPVSVTSMTGIPASHAGLASGFLMTGHEVGAALGVAALSAVATTAGSLTTPAGAADGFARGFLAAAVLAVVVAVVAFSKMPASRAAAGTGMHLHH